jgi:hypothetical protein
VEPRPLTKCCGCSGRVRNTGISVPEDTGCLFFQNETQRKKPTELDCTNFSPWNKKNPSFLEQEKHRNFGRKMSGSFLYKRFAPVHVAHDPRSRTQEILEADAKKKSLFLLKKLGIESKYTTIFGGSSAFSTESLLNHKHLA